MECDHEREAVKKRYLIVIVAAFLRSAFPELYRNLTRDKLRPLALSEFRRYISRATTTTAKAASEPHMTSIAKRGPSRTPRRRALRHRACRRVTLLA